MAPITFYHFAPSAPSRSTLLAFRNLNLDVNVQEVNLFVKDQLKPEFTKLNPQHTVPTIDDNGFVLWESRAINAYLAQQYAPGSSIYPSDPKQKALIDQRLYFDAGILYPRIRQICFPVLFLGETKISDENRKQLKEAFEFMNTFLEGRTWFAGDNVTIADLSILASLSSIVHVGANLSEYKNLAAWFERCKVIPGYAENDEGAKIFGGKVRGNLTEQF